MKKNTKDDIWKFVNKLDEKSCWHWIGSTFLSTGYGRFFFEGKAHVAHRFIYKMLNGEIDKYLMVMHKCNNKICCNPNHLILGTNSDNQNHASMYGCFKLGKTGIRGISYIDSRKYWSAQAYKNGKRLNLYTGPHYEKAINARKNWEKINGITFNL